MATDEALRPVTVPVLRTATGTRFAILLILTFGVLGILTLAAFLLPRVSYARIASEADSVINTAGMVAAAAVAGFAVLRYRDSGAVDALLQSSAFVVLFLPAAVRTVVVAGGIAPYDSYYAIESAGQAPLYGSLFSQFLAGELLSAGAVAILRQWQPLSRRNVAILLLAPAVMTLVMVAFATSREGSLPELLPPETLQELLRPDAFFDTRLISLPHLTLRLGAAFIFGVAAYAYGRAWLRGERGTYTALLALSLVVGAFSQVHFALVPGGYNDVLTSGDFLRLAFYLLALTAVAWAIQEDLGRLRQAYSDLARLRAADAERISAETRAGLAREVHDGLVQELWLARLTGGQLSAIAGMPAEAKPIITRLDETLETAMAEARQALVTLQPETEATFSELLRRFVEDYASRFDLDIRAEIGKGAEPNLTADVQGELLRICREALNNVRKHADASVVRVRLAKVGDVTRISVADNGAGFNVDAVDTGFGLASMRQRAAKIGATLTIRSAEMDGTTVTIEIPRGEAG